MKGNPLVFVGLGNPGPAYARTRHNYGFMFIDKLAHAAGISVRQRAFSAQMGEGTLAGVPILLIKPLTYMNRSGATLQQLQKARGPVPLEHLWVAHDDLDLPLGSLRIRMQGSAGGHRGVRSLTQVLGSKNFGRFRLGIGRPADGSDPADYVLDPYQPEELQLVEEVLNRSVEAAGVLIREGAEAAMTRFND